jgi:hypothetical protein
MHARGRSRLSCKVCVASSPVYGDVRLLCMATLALNSALGSLTFENGQTSSNLFCNMSLVCQCLFSLRWRCVIRNISNVFEGR